MKLYKKKLLHGAIIADDQGESILDFLKSVNMSKVVQYASEAWSEVKATTLRKSWEKIIPIAAQPLVRPSIDGTLASALAWKGMDEGAFQSLAQVKYDPAEDETPPVKMRKSCKNPSFYSGGIRSRFTWDFMSGPAPQTFIQFQGMFQELGHALTQQEVAEWLDQDANDPGVQLYTDSEICDLVSSRGDDMHTDNEVEEEGYQACPVSNSQAASYFDQCLTWLEHQSEATIYNTTLLRELQSLAASKRAESLKQTKVTNYFQPQ